MYAFGNLQTVVKVYFTLELQTKKFLPDKVLSSVYTLIKHIYINIYIYIYMIPKSIALPQSLS